MTLTSQQIERYKRQILIPEIGAQGQMRLLSSHVMVIGVGALGGPLALYLAAAGIGKLTLFDDDRVDLSNLQRQIHFTTDDIGKPKVFTLAARLAALNPDIDIDPHETRFTGQAESASATADLIIDASDNFTTRFAINAFSLQHDLPMLSGAVGRWDAQIGLFNAQDGSPCYRCWIGDAPDDATNCIDDGVSGPLCGLVASIMAMETVKICAGADSPLDGKILAISGLDLGVRRLALRADSACPICADALVVR